MTKTDLTLREKALDFLSDLAWAVKGIPSVAAEQWRDSRRWDRPKGTYEMVPDGNHWSLIFVPDPDHLLWKKLGPATDAILAILALAIVILTVTAVGYIV